MPALPGLRSLYDTMDREPAGSIDEGALQAYQQGAPDERHADPGDTSGQTWPGGYGLGYRGQPTYGEAPEKITDYDPLPSFYPGPGILDETPSSHGGLWPRPMATAYSTVNPDQYAYVTEQMAVLHGKEEGGSYVLNRDAPGGREALVDITVDRYEAPNQNVLQKTIGHLRGILGGVGAPGGGSHLGQADVTQGYGQLNSLPEFQAGHSIRIVQHDKMPMDYTALHGDEGTWLGKHPSGTERRFDGPDSPYGAMGDGQGLQRAGRATTLGYPTQYESPSAPTVLPSRRPTTDVWAYG